MSLAAMVLADRGGPLIGSYDRWIRLITLGHDKRVRQAALEQIRPGDRVLDVGCGTGTLAVAAARSGAQVIGIDRSPQMLALARQKAASEGVSVDWRQGDAAFPPIGSERFDVVTATLVLSELSRDLAAVTLRRLAAVLRPSGLLVVADEVEPRNPLLRLATAIPRSLQAVLAFVALEKLAPTRRHAWQALIEEAGLEVVSKGSGLGGSLIVIVAQRPAKLPRRSRPILPLAEALPTGLRARALRFGAWLDLPIAVRSGIYAIGHPTSQSHVLLTGNFLASVVAVSSAMAGRDAYLVVEDTDGWNVWCAGDAGLFNAERAAALFSLHALDEVVERRRIVVPRLAGRVRSRLAALTGWEVEIGPLEARDLPAYLASGLGPEMRSLERLYGTRERIRVAALTLIQLPLFLLPLRWAPRRIRRPVWRYALTAACLLPLAHDRLPGRTGIAKSSALGLGFAIVGVGARRLRPGSAAAIVASAPLVGWIYQSSTPVVFWKRIWR
jgi:ubiquinone/menaquinone biosynthesis C-methylase UbiE